MAKSSDITYVQRISLLDYDKDTGFLYGNRAEVRQKRAIEQEG